MKTLVLDNETWCRGTSGEETSALLNINGKMCCLGFLAKQCGASDEQIYDKLMPNQASSFGGRFETCLKPSYWSNLGNVNFPKGLISKDGSDSELGNSIAVINDDNEIDDKTRIKKLNSKFKRLGYKLVLKKMANDSKFSYANHIND